MRLSDIGIREFAEWKTAADFGGSDAPFRMRAVFLFIRFQGEDLNRNGQDGRIWLIIRTQKENIVSQNEE